MHTTFPNNGFRYYPLDAVDSPTAPLNAMPASPGFFTEFTEGREIRFEVIPFQQPNAQSMCAVQSADRLPLLREVIEALEARHD